MKLFSTGSAGTKHDLRRLLLGKSKSVKHYKSTRKKPVNIGPDQVAEVVSMMTGIPVTRVVVSESERLLNLEDELGKHIIGQRKAITSIAKSVRRNP